MGAGSKTKRPAQFKPNRRERGFEQEKAEQMKAPTFKHQAPVKLQAPNTRSGPRV
jgi:hypothetical protein